MNSVQTKVILWTLAICLIISASAELQPNLQYPQGYYPFEESPAKIPPKVRKPPYLQTQVNCPGAGGPSEEQTLDNLCGDLNKGYLPINPIGQNVLGVSYPFELIKNKTLDFFSKTLPILKADDTLPKVAKYQDNHILYNPTIFNSQPNTRIQFYENSRNKRDILHTEEEAEIENDASDSNTPWEARSGDASTPRESRSGDASTPQEARSGDASTPREARSGDASTPRESRSGWCDDSHGVFCMLFNAIKGGDAQSDSARDRLDGDIPAAANINSLDQPMTPCPSAVEYVTPVFAKNYQGVWRYVVQIPYEGYFTQTVEVVKCLSTKCEFLDGSCLASPRWVSLLVAEIYYPDTYFPTADQPIPGRNPIKASPPSDVHQFLHRSNQAKPNSPTPNCDGSDEMGCFHVRLYYDWFLIPGSCKCWKNDFFAQYTKKR